MEEIKNIEWMSVARESPGFSSLPIQHIILAGSQPFPRPLPLLIEQEDMVWGWLSHHHKNPNLPPARAINCYFIRDLIMVGHDTVFVENRIATGNEMIPAYRANLIRSAHSNLVAEKLKLPCKIIEEPCFPLASDGNVYGHFLIESLARLHIVTRFLHTSLPRYKILIVKNLPVWVRLILKENYGIKSEDIIEYDPENEQVLLRQAIWPSLTIFQDHFHPYFNMIISDLLASLSVLGGLKIDRVFVSRIFFNNAVMQDRILFNEHEIGEIAVKEFGFSPIAPETLDWTEQIRLFANAKIVVGRFGSGMHNALFSNRGSRIGIIRFGNLVQSGISALRQQNIAYLTANNDEIPYIVNEDKFRYLLNDLTR